VPRARAVSAHTRRGARVLGADTARAQPCRLLNSHTHARRAAPGSAPASTGRPRQGSAASASCAAPPQAQPSCPLPRAGARQPAARARARGAGTARSLRGNLRTRGGSGRRRRGARVVLQYAGTLCCTPRAACC
jgi:hypothetical protein